MGHGSGSWRSAIAGVEERQIEEEGGCVKRWNGKEGKTNAQITEQFRCQSNWESWEKSKTGQTSRTKAIAKDSMLLKTLKFCSRKLTHQQGDREALNGLGIIHRDGLLVPTDKQKAFHYFQAAASQDLAEAQVNLAKLHLGEW